MTIVVTGHRPNKLGFEYGLIGPYTRHLETETEAIVNEYKPDRIITGLALGYDQIVALLAIRLGIPLTIAIPCVNQDKKWPPLSKSLYQYLYEHAIIKHWVSKEPYNNHCMQDRNVWMVDQLIKDDFLLAASDGTPGGTANCIEYAISKNKNIKYINPKSWI